MSNFYNSIKVLKTPRSKFNLSYDHKTTCDMGQLIPIGNWICYPNDKIKMSNKAVIRTQPLVAPMLHRIKVKVDAFFVPFRLIWDKWEDFYTGGKDGESFPTLPRWDSYYTQNADVPKYSLWDYMARCSLKHSNTTNDPDALFVPHDLLRRAYNLIYNEYYINRNLQDDVSLENDDVLFRNFKNDYFASALPFQQRGISPALNISLTDAPVVWSKDAGNIPASNNYYYYGPNYMGANDFATNKADIAYKTYIVGPSLVASKKVLKNMDFQAEGLTLSGNDANLDRDEIDGVPFRFRFKNGSPFDEPIEGYDPGIAETYNTMGLKANLSQASAGFDANELRNLMQTQKYLERNARAGSRYTEQLLARWGVFAGDARMQRPEHIYSTTNIIIVDEVPQTSETGDTPQGHLSGKGTGVLVNPNCGRYTCKEHGVVIQLLSLVPDLSYIPQGYDKEMLWQNRYHLYNPEFAHISEQPIKKGELYFNGTPETDNALFGYEPAWSELRHRRNVVSADMRDTFAYWHLARKFANQPALNGDFVKIDGTTEDMKRVFASGTSAKAFIVDFANEFVALRPLPKYGTPGLVDHF